MRVYYSQSGDTLAGIASHFLVPPNELQQPLSLGEQELLPPGTSIMIPDRLSNRAALRPARPARC
jgi:LysM repeat protein